MPSSPSTPTAAEKTYATFELTVTNPGGHSSTPRTDNAIYQLATALKNLEAYRFPVLVNDADEHAAEVLWHQPEQVGITRTTCVTTMLRAGHAEDALPQSATATVNCRIFPGVEVPDVQAVAAAVHARFPGVPVIPSMAAYGTDGKEVRAAGIPTYGVAELFMKDSDPFAHGLNERVQVRSFFGALDHWKALLTGLAGHPAT